MTTLLRVPGAVALLLGLAGCAGIGTRSPTEMPAGVSTWLSPGERARLPDGAQLDYRGLRSDSRCPPRVTCIHAGWAEIGVEYASPEGIRWPLVLSTRAGGTAIGAGAWRIELVELGRGPSPLARLRASPAAR